MITMTLDVPKVTVLMPIYNGMPYLRQALESVLSQTFTDFECLLIDDASTDDSLLCIQTFLDPRIRLIRNTHNLGQIASLNQGLELARGDYIARFDQDDLCLPTRLQRQVIFLDEHPEVAVVGTWMRGMDAMGRLGRVLAPHLDDYPSFLASLLQGSCNLCHPSVMYRRDVLTNLGCYDPKFKAAADYELWSRLARQHYQARVIPEILALYRMHERQQSSIHAEAHHRNWHRAHQELIHHFYTGAQIQNLSRLLLLDESFWSLVNSKAQLLCVLEAMETLFNNIRVALGLSSDEMAVVIRQICAWIGWGFSSARSRQHWPSVLFHLMVLLGSPRLMLKKYPRLFNLARKWRTLDGEVSKRNLQICHRLSLL